MSSGKKMGLLTVKFIAFVLSALISICVTEKGVAGNPPDNRPWLMQDAEAAIDAALLAAEGAEAKSDHAQKLADLAAALIEAGRNSRARSVLAKASSLLESPNEFMSKIAREKIIESLARLGAVAEAEQLAAVDAKLEVKVGLQGKLGKGLAEAGDSVGAIGVASQIEALGPFADSPAAALFSSNAIAKISIALAAKGAAKEAMEAVSKLVGGWQKQRTLSELARDLCTTTKTGPEKAAVEHEIATRAATNARLVLGIQDHPEHKVAFKIGASDGTLDVAVEASFAIAVCERAAQAVDFAKDIATPQSVDAVLDRLADELTARGKFDLASTVAQVLDPQDAEALIRAATRLLKQGDAGAAKSLALAASKIVRPGDLKAARLYEIADVLAEAGAYDAARAALQPLDEEIQGGMYLRMLFSAATTGNTAKIAWALPRAGKPLNGGPELFDVAKVLAKRGFYKEAETIFAKERGSFGSLQNPVYLRELALIRAEMGDVAGALAAADNMGPLAGEPSNLQVGLVATMQFDAPRAAPPTNEEFADAWAKAKSALPPLVPGQKAIALGSIVEVLARQGNLQAAWQAESLLEAEPRDVLAGTRDWALLSIAKQQVETRDLRDALSTALKITGARTRWEPLLKLAAIPPDSRQ